MGAHECGAESSQGAGCGAGAAPRRNDPPGPPRGLHRSDRIPVEAEFACQHDIDVCRLYDWPEFAHALAIFRCKMEAALEHGGMYGKLNPRMTIFASKQLGWTDPRWRGDDETPLLVIASERTATRS